MARLAVRRRPSRARRLEYLRQYGTYQVESGLLSLLKQVQHLWEEKHRSVDIASLCENATTTSIPDSSMDYIVSAFGLKTLSRQAMTELAREIRRILKPGGRFSLIEISFPTDWLFGAIFRWYVSAVIPIIGRMCLGDIECYRMLGAYTTAFGSCDRIAPLFRDIGLEVSVKGHFYDCATSLVGYKAG